jgi:hypothetical protein
VVLPSIVSVEVAEGNQVISLFKVGICRMRQLF